MKIKREKVVGLSTDPEDFDLKSKNLVFDQYCEGFVTGSSGTLTTWEKTKNDDVPLVIRGLGTSGREALKHCMETGREFYAIDTGYLQLQTSKAKLYHRVTKNNLQNLGPLVERPEDRLNKLKWKLNKPPVGDKILICPPSEKVMLFYNKNLQKWIAETISEIKKHSDREIIIREKPSRFERVTSDSIWKALDDAYCLVTFNSIAASEAYLYGVPAIALAPNAASVVCNTSLSDIEKLRTPPDESRYRFAKHLSYCQFTLEEMKTGYAWEIVNQEHQL